MTRPQGRLRLMSTDAVCVYSNPQRTWLTRGVTWDTLQNFVPNVRSPGPVRCRGAHCKTCSVVRAPTPTGVALSDLLQLSPPGPRRGTTNVLCGGPETQKLAPAETGSKSTLPPSTPSILKRLDSYLFQAWLSERNQETGEDVGTGQFEY